MSSTLNTLIKQYNVSAGAVLRDKEFCFEGDEKVSPKWLIILSNKLIEKDLIFTLTTSQIDTYTGSFNKYIQISRNDEQCFDRDCIVEIERTHPVRPELLLDKFERNATDHKGFISSDLLSRIFQEIAECDTIYGYIKEGLGVYD